jgi:hypothetical protein
MTIAPIWAEGSPEWLIAPCRIEMMRFDQPGPFLMIGISFWTERE